MYHILLFFYLWSPFFLCWTLMTLLCCHCLMLWTMSTQSLASFSSSLAISSGVAKVPGPKVSKRCDKGGGCSSSAKTELKKTKGTHIKVPECWSACVRKCDSTRACGNPGAKGVRSLLELCVRSACVWGYLWSAITGAIALEILSTILLKRNY